MGAAPTGRAVPITRSGTLGQRQEQSDYLVANLMAHYDITPQISAQLNVNNLLDQEHRTGVNWYGQGIWGAPGVYWLP